MISPRTGNAVAVIAEVGPNHGGSFTKAAKLVEAAAEAGADAVKLQLYEPSDLAVDSDHPAHRMPDDGGPWAGRRLYDLYTEGRTPTEWYPKLKDVGTEHGVAVFASVFSKQTVHHLIGWGCPVIKVASAEVEDQWLLEEVAHVTDAADVVLSDGVAARSQLAHAVHLMGPERCTVLHCVSGYPAHPSAYDLGLLDWYRALVPQVGVSDHTLGSALAVAAVARGATVLEKHIMLPITEHERPPLDAGHSLTPDQFARYVRDVRGAEQLVVDMIDQLRPTAWRRRVLAARDLKPGSTVRFDDLITRRAGEGVIATDVGRLIGGTVQVEVARHEPVPVGAIKPSRRIRRV